MASWIIGGIIFIFLNEQHLNEYISNPFKKSNIPHTMLFKYSMKFKNRMKAKSNE